MLSEAPWKSKTELDLRLFLYHIQFIRKPASRKHKHQLIKGEIYEIGSRRPRNIGG